jgi:hypothetical protein
MFRTSPTQHQDCTVTQNNRLIFPSLPVRGTVGRTFVSALTKELCAQYLEQPERLGVFTVFLDRLTLEDGTDMLSRNVGNHHSTLRNIPEERTADYTAVKTWNLAERSLIFFSHRADLVKAGLLEFEKDLSSPKLYYPGYRLRQSDVRLNCVR